jgi:Tol biopolymer transport system component
VRRFLTLLAACMVVLLVSLPQWMAAASARGGHHRHHRVNFLVWSRFNNDATGTARLVVAKGGRPAVALSHPPTGVQDIDPRVSPNGHRILFERDFPDRSESWVIALNGSGERKINLGCVDPCAGTNTPSWTPDGRHLLYDRVSGPFDHEGNAATANLWKSDLQGRHNHRFSEPGLNPTTEETDASFAPAGYLIVLHGRRDGHTAIFRERHNGTHPRQLTPWSLNADLPAVSPAKSGPSRNLVVFETYGSGAPDGATLGQQVATVPATCRSVATCQNKIRYLTRSSQPAADFNPSWSPTGRRIVYVHFVGNPSGPSVGDIWTMRWNGTHKHPFSQDKRFEFRPAWGRAR